MSEKLKVKLMAEDGMLRVPRESVYDKELLKWLSGNPVLLCVYDAGDCDTANWPKVDEDILSRALFHARETGLIPGDSREVELPNGETFKIDR